MSADIEKPVNSFEDLSPAKKNEQLFFALNQLPHHLTKGTIPNQSGKSDVVFDHNVAYLNDLTKGLAHSEAPPSVTKYLLLQAARATESGIESLRLTPEVEEDPQGAFPDLFFVDLDPAGIFAVGSAQIVTQRAIKRIYSRIGVDRGTAVDFNLYLQMSNEYRDLYHQNPFDEIVVDEVGTPSYLVDDIVSNDLRVPAYLVRSVLLDH